MRAVNCGEKTSEIMPAGKAKRELQSPLDARVTDIPRGANETLDTLFQGRIKLYQSRSGYRVSLDAILLANFMTTRPEDKIADLGTGSGVVALIIASMHPSSAIVGVEVQQTMAERAARNVKLNQLENRVRIVCADILALAQNFNPESFSVVTANPPYRKADSGRISSDAEKRIARHEVSATLTDFVAAGAYLLPIKGRMALIYPAVRTTDLLATMRRLSIEPKRLRMVHSYRDGEASLVLVEGVKGGRGAVRVLSPLVLYDKASRYTPEIHAVLAGELSPKRR
jgi:tRNA1Val (adenine37-N6)-methyltransferase